MFGGTTNTGGFGASTGKTESPSNESVVDSSPGGGFGANTGGGFGNKPAFGGASTTTGSGLFGGATAVNSGSSTFGGFGGGATPRPQRRPLAVVTQLAADYSATMPKRQVSAPRAPRERHCLAAQLPTQGAALVQAAALGRRTTQASEAASEILQALQLPHSRPSTRRSLPPTKPTRSRISCSKNHTKNGLPKNSD